jgi:hypothetical protein
MREQQRQQHSETPWRINTNGYLAKASGGFVPIESPFTEIAPASEAEATANIAYIARAINSHEKLVGVAREVVKRYESAFALTPDDANLLNTAIDALALAGATCPECGSDMEDAI